MNKKHNFDKWSPYSVYILGFLWADGYLRKKDSGIVLTIVEEDGIKIKPIIKKTGEWSFRYIQPKNSERRQIRMQLYDKALKEFLLRYRYDVKSLVSPELLLSEIPDKYLHYWWRGFFDGDGSNNANGIEFYGHFEQDWSFMNILSNKLGGIVFKYKQRIRGYGRSSFINIRHKNSIQKFLLYINSGEKFGLDRKHHSKPERKKFSTYRGVFKARHGRVRAQFKMNDVMYFLGNFSSEIEAAKAYDKKAKEMLGDRAVLNFF